MSFNGYKEKIEEGDTVVIFLSVSNMHTFLVTRDKVFQTKYGALKHNDLIGKPFGSLVNCSKGWAYVLHPTPELWTINLPHRTQILYMTDISVITLQLDLKPGSIVLESGTGSGSLSHALIRTIAPNGHLYTFDFHEERAERCQQEFQTHCVSHLVTVEHRDVVSNGFGLENVADAVFLDLPLPWEVIPFAKKAMKMNGGRICSFSPCIEQVQKTCEALRSHGFADVTTMECVQRLLDVRSVTMPICQIGTSKDKRGSKTVHEAMEVSEGGPEGTEKPWPDAAPEVTDSGGTRSSPQDVHRERAPCNTTFMEALPSLQQVGHTGYLTFATLYPRLPKEVADVTLDPCT